MKELNFYKELIHHSNFGYAYHRIVVDEYGKPTDYTFIEVNSAFGDLTGLDPTNIKNKRVTELIPGIENSEFDWIAYYGDIALNCNNGSFEQYLGLHNKWYKVQVFSFEKYYFTTIFIDITADKKNSEQLENFFSINLDLLCIADLDGNFIKVNKAWEDTLGYSINDLINSKFFDYIHPDDLEKTYLAIADLSLGKEVVNFVNRYRCTEGLYKHIEWRSRSVGNIIYAAARDISDRIAIEDELKARNEQFELANRGSNDGIWDWDVKNDTLYLSPRWKEIIGYRDDELENKYSTFDSCIYPKDLDIVNQALKEYFAGDSIEYKMEFRMKHKLGHYVWIASKGMALRDSQGVVLRMIGSHSDISEQKRAENNLKLAKETYKGILDSISELVYILSKDGKFLDVNQAVIDKYGYPKEYFWGNSPDFLSADDKNNLDAVADAIHKAALGENQHFEFWGKRADGTIFPKEVNLTPGKFFGKDIIITVARDISERKANERKLQESEQKYRLIAENADDVIWTLDLQGNITYISPSIFKLRGLTVEEAMAESVPDTMPTQWAEYVQKHQESALNDLELGGKYPSGVHEIQQYHKDGHLVWVEMLVNGLYDDNNELIGVFGVSRSADQRKAVEAELIEYTHKLKKAISEKDKFFSIIAHDLKVPLSGFLGLTKSLAEEFNNFKIKELKEFGEDLQESAKNLYVLLENLLEWARLQMDMTEFQPESCQPKFIVDQNIDAMSKDIELKKIKVINSIPDKLTVDADVSMLNSILKNLISNAIKYTASEGIVQVGQIDDERYGSCFFVKDNGIGISKDLQSKIFKFDKNNTNAIGTNTMFGSGLGLLLVNEYVKKHNGSIYLESEEELGSIFYFTLNNSQ